MSLLKTKVYNSYNHPKVKVSPSGTGIEPVYEYQEDKKTGIVKRVKVGETNVYKFIQENAKLCGLDLLISQLKAGDMSGLVKSGGLYADDKDLPKTIHEAKEKTDAMINKWRSNPILKKIYKTPDEYIDDLFAGAVIGKVNNYYRVESEKVKKDAENALKTPKVDKVDKVSPSVKPEINTDIKTIDKNPQADLSK